MTNYKRLIDAVPISQHDWANETEPLVTIICTTYNHSEFIHDTIKGFLSQKTTFPVEICIHDDASNDGTSEIIKNYQSKYPKLIKIFIQKFNTYNRKDKVELRAPFYSLAKGKFIATCEGDDFWINDEKLEKQINLISKNSNTVFVGGRSIVGETRDAGVIDPPLNINFASLNSNGYFKGVWLHTNTRLIDADYFSKFSIEIQREYRSDLGFVLHTVRKSMLGEIKISAIDDVVGFYRINGRGVWSSKNELGKFISNTRYILYFMRKYSGPKEYQDYLMDNLRYFVKDFIAKKERIGLLQGVIFAFSMFRAGVDFKFIINFIKNSLYNK